MNREQTAAVLAILRTVWQSEEITAERITAYQWAFEDVAIELVQDAAKRWIKTGKFFPRPSELLEIISVQTVAPNLVPEAAWEEVMREVRRCGHNRLPEFRNGAFIDPPKPVFSSPLIADTVGSLGWVEICTSDKPGIVRAQFVKTLESLMGRAVRSEQIGDRPDSLTAIGAAERKAIA